MASVYHFTCDANQTISQVIEEEWQTEESREKLNQSAVTIQSYFRGMVVRNYMRKLHHAATIIQKNVRRFLVKINLPNYLLAYLENRALSFYNKMATKIQAAFRGYTFRKNTFNISGMRKQEQKLKVINDKLKVQVENTKNQLESSDVNKTESEAKDMVLFILFKVHHLLRTNREGILSDYNSRELSWIENLLKSLRFTEYMKVLRNVYDATYQELPERPCIIKGRMRECEKAYYMKYKGDDVKTTPLTNINAFEHKKPFKLSSKVEKKYVPMALTRGKYTLPITTILRDLDNIDNISVTDFDVTQKVVPHRKLHPDYYIDFWKKICAIHQFPEYK